MRFPSFPSIILALQTFTLARASRSRIFPLLSQSGRIRDRHLVVKSMPTIPFLASLFSSSSATASAEKMSFPVEKSKEEWQAVLNKGSFFFLIFPFPFLGYKFRVQLRHCLCSQPTKQTSPQNNSASSAKKAPKPPTPGFTTNTCPAAASTPASAAPLLSIKPRINSNPVVAGPRSSMRYLAPSRATWTVRSACRARKSCAVIVGGISVMCSRGRGILRRRMRGIVLIALV